MSEMEIAKISAKLDFIINDKALKAFNLKLIGIIGSISKFTNDTVKAVVGLDNFNKRAGIEPQVINEWELLAKQSNISGESIKEAFENIVNMKGKLLAGEGMDTAWGLLGINGNENPEEIFEKVLSSLGEIENINLRNKRIADLGFDPQIVNLIGKSRDELEGLFKGLVLNNEERKNILDFKKSLVDLMNLLAGIKDKFVALYFPLKNFIDLIFRITSITYNFIESTIGLKRAVAIISGIFAVWFAKTKPLYALLYVLMLIIEDIVSYFEGKDSVFGMVIEWFKNLGDGAKSLIYILGGLGAVMMTTFAYGKIATMVKGINSLTTSLMAVGSANGGLMTIAGSLGLVAASLITAVAIAVKGKKRVEEIGEKLLGYDEGTVKANEKKIHEEAYKIGVSKLEQGINPGKNWWSTYGQTYNNQKYDIKINIDGAKSPQETSNQILNDLQTQLNKTNNIFGGGF